MGETQAIDTHDGDRLVSIHPDASSRLGVSRATVYELHSRGELRTVKLGRRRMVRESDLQAFIASLSGGV